MAGRRAHKLSTGMVVSGPKPLPAKERPPTMSSAAAPYVAGDIRFSGEFARMFDIPIDRPPPVSSSLSHSGPALRASGIASAKINSGPFLQPTGLITSDPIGRRSGEILPVPSLSTEKKMGVAPGVTVMACDIRFWFWLPKAWILVSAVAFLVAIGVGVFVWVAVGRPQIFLTLAGAAAVVGVVALWNWARGRRELERFFRDYPDTSINPRILPVGKLVKITGLVTCGNTPLETSYQNVPRCVYTFIELYERKPWSNLFSTPYRSHNWSLRRSERLVADFYISDLNTGLRILVRAGNGAKVASFVKPTTTLYLSNKNREKSPSFLSWLQDNSIPTDDLVMRLEEGFIREGSTVSVIGTLRTNQNLIMLDPPDEAASTGWQWTRCLLPMHVEGLILVGDEVPQEELCHA